MNNKLQLTPIFLLTFVVSFTVFSQPIPTDSLYLGQTPPGNTPIVFAPNRITQESAYTVSFSPDNSELIYTARHHSYYSVYTNAGWSRPVEHSFTGMFEMEALFAPYGHKIFISAGDMINRWAPDELYEVNKMDTWQSPIKLNALNSEDYEFYASASIDSTIYFTRATDGPNYIYFAEMRNGVYNTPVKMDTTVSITSDCTHPFVSPDGTYLLFEVNQSDLYVSFKKIDKTWSNSIKLGSSINTLQDEGYPTLSPDGKYFFFSRGNFNTNTGNIYWVSTDFIDSLKQTVSSIEQKSEIIPKDFNLFQNYPNPFNPSTNIQYSLSKPSQVKLSIYNLLGQEIKLLKNAFQNAGEYSLVWDATDNENNPVSSGMYFYSLETNNQTLQKKMMYIK
jgi:hypothetical protein